MRKFLTLLAVLLALVAIAPLAQAQNSNLHYQNGIFYAPAYATWRGSIVQGNAATGSGNTIIVALASALADGYVPPATSIFNTNVPITISDNTNSGAGETVTPSAVSVGVCPVGNAGLGNQYYCGTITGTFDYVHGTGSAFVVGSGDAGIEEAITDAGAQNGGEVYWQVDTGIVTLATGGLTTTTTTMVPTTFFNLGAGAAARVTTTITTSANWAIGVSGSTAAFCAANSTLTAGTLCKTAASTVVGTGSTALTAVLITAGTSDAGAGALKARVWGVTPVSASQ